MKHPQPNETLYRDATFTRESANLEARTCEMSCSTETPVERYFGLEILDHSPKSIDLSRMENGAALLLGHNTDDQIGVIESCSIVDRELRAIARFSRSKRAEEIWQDVQDGIRRSVSIGYQIKKVVPEKDAAGMETCRVIQWTPHEVSIVAIPGDKKAKIIRSEQLTPNLIPQEPTQIMPENITTTETPALTFSKKDASTILTIGRQFDCLDKAQSAIDAGVTADAFRAEVMAGLATRQQAITATTASIGMSRKDVTRWSLVRAVNALASQGGRLDGIEKEASDAMARLIGREASGFYIPHDVAVSGTRALDATGDASLGGYTVGTDVMGGSLIELLRNQTVAFALGVRQMTGLMGNVAIPSAAGGATAYWVAENAAVTPSNQTFGQVGLTPHRLSGQTAYSKRLLAQSTVDVESFVREDLARVLAIATDLAVLAGTSQNGQPTGILATSGVGSVTFGAAATMAKLLEFETAVAAANALQGGLAYVVSPATRAKLKAAPKIGTTFPSFLWDNGTTPGEGIVNGYRAVATGQLTSAHKVIFGNWQDAIVGTWAGMDVVVDPYTAAGNHQVILTVNMMVDFAVRHAGSFAISSDSGAQ